MNKYLKQLGVTGDYEFCDILGIDEGLLSMVPQPILSVLMLFPVSEASENHRRDEEKRLSESSQVVSKSVFYMKQTVGNACGTVGLIHACLNNGHKLTFEPGKFFAKFASQTQCLSAEQRASALEEDIEIEEEHQAVASEAKSDVTNNVNDNLHFNAFVCVDNCLYELDGRKKRPINHGPSSPATLLLDAVKVIKGFMERDPNEIRFNMVALAPKGAAFDD